MNCQFNAPDDSLSIVAFHCEPGNGAVNEFHAPHKLISSRSKC